jgi:hypothetical protein
MSISVMKLSFLLTEGDVVIAWPRLYFNALI